MVAETVVVCIKIEALLHIIISELPQYDQEGGPFGKGYGPHRAFCKPSLSLGLPNQIILDADHLLPSNKVWMKFYHRKGMFIIRECEKTKHSKSQ